MSAKVHHTPIQVRFVDIDKQGHVNNATFLSYVETARVQFFHDSIGPDIDWQRTGMIIARTEINYFEPIFLEDMVFVSSFIRKIGTKSFEVANQVFKESPEKPVLCADCVSVIVCMDYSTKSTIPVPDAWRETFAAWLSE